MLNKIKNIIEERDKTHGDWVDCLEQITGTRYGESNARKHIAVLRKICNMPNGVNSEHGRMLSMEVDSNGNRKVNFIVDLLALKDKSPANLLKTAGYDIAQWKLNKFRFSEWQSPRKKDDPQDLYAMRLEIQPTQDKVSLDFMKSLFDEITPAKLTHVEYNAGKLLLELPMMDFHLGKFAWHEETRVDYDIKIAVDLYKQTVLDIIARVNAYGLEIEQILSPIGQDFFHYDDEKQQTTKGTVQDTDTRWQKMFRAGCELKVWELEQLRAIAPVKCHYVQSNHDYKMSWHLAEWLNAYYRLCESVTVDTTIYPRKYYQYGACMIGYSHGDQEKKRIEYLMQAEEAKMWGNTRFREWHLGHLHHEESKEIPGLKIRRISSITATDKWHAKQGYISTIRQAQAFVWDKKKGLQNIINSTVAMEVKE